MKLTKKIETEITQFLQTYWDTYFEGNLSQWQSFITENYKNIGTNQEEIWNSKKEVLDYTNEVLDQMVGNAVVRNKTVQIIPYDPYIMTHELGDLYIKNGKNWTFYAPIRLSSLIQKQDTGWIVLHQHGSFPDSKTQKGEAFAVDAIKAENVKLQKAVQKRTIELEQKNRELEVETALERIRAQAVAMKESSDLLDIVVSMRNEFIKLGHEAHYFWHMMWLPKTYEKAMTSGDGSKIGFVMELPRHIHGDIPQLAKWEKSKKQTVVYTMNVEEAIDYVDKMVALGNFKSIDPQAPSHDDIKHIGGLTFIMARTTHGEIGYSLPGMVSKPPKEDIDILVKFASAFDLAHQRFLDLQKAEKQARETQIELSLERIRSRVTAMQESSDLFDIVVTMRNEFLSLGHEADYFWHMKWTKDNYEMSMTAEDGGRLGMVITVPKFVHEQIKPLYKWEKSKSPYFVLALNGKEAWDYIEKMNTYGKYQLIDPHAPSEEDILHIGGLTFIIARTTHGEIGFSLAGKVDNPPKASIDILVRFASVFDLAYKRFEDLKKAEARARETQIELALEKVRSRTMAMQHSDELQEASFLLDQQVRELGIKTWGCAFNIYGENESTEWFGNEAGVLHTYTVPRAGIFKEYYDKGQKGESLFIQEFSGDDCVAHYEYMSSLPVIGDVLKTLKKTNKGFPTYQIDHVVYFKYGYLLFITRETVPDAHDIFKRFAKVFEQTYTRFLDLQKAEAQAREAQIEASLERVRSASMAMHKTEDLFEVVVVYFEQLKQLNIEFVQSWITIFHLDQGYVDVWFSPLEGIYKSPQHFQMPSALFEDTSIKSWKEGLPFSNISFQTKDDVDKFMQICDEVTNTNYFSKTQKKLKLERFEMLDANHKYGCISKSNVVEANTEEKELLSRFAKVFEQTYTRFLDLQKAEKQAKEAQIEAALERTRTQSMLMQHSDELDATSKVFHEQLQLLGIDTEFSYVWLPDEAKNEHQFWVAWNSEQNKEDINSKAIVYPLDKTEPYTAACFKDWSSGITVHIHHIKPKEVKTFFSAWEELLKDAKNLTPKYFSNGLYYAEAFMKYGCFGINIKRSITEEEKQILQRFSIEFERTYTRFLDLKRAEAQARESQIETSLERVRSRSMAMHNSEELKDVIQVLYDQFIHLNINIEHAGFILDYKENDDMHIWLADHNAVFPKIVLPYFDCAHWNSFLEAKKTGKNFFTNTLGFKEKNKFYKDLFEHIPDLPEETKKTYFGFKGLAISTVLLDNVGLYIENYSGTPFSEEENNILMRFGKVFQQSYTRFLDLQKAEAQAREARIEAALERVRSRAMAMHNTDELTDVLCVLFDQFDILGINPVLTHLTLFDLENETFSLRITTTAKNRIVAEQFIDINAVEAWKNSFENWKNSNPNAVDCIDYSQEQLPFVWELLSEVMNALPKGHKIYPKDFPDGLYTTQGHFKFGYIGFNHSRRATDEEKAIVERFAKEFGRTYQRFLDLQKSEAQARESQIEAALERVRSQSMGMQTSKDLSSVTTEMFNQLRQFGGDLFATGIVFCDKHEGHVEQWHSIPNAGMMSPFIVPIDLDYIHQYRYDEWNKGSELFEIEIPSDFIEQHFQGIFNLPSAQKVLKDLADQNTPMPEAPPWEIDYGASFKHGYLLVSSLQRFKEAEILPRFAKVFEQAYTRFLDLKKAEAQARESQIEAALEKVRSRSLAMRSTNELKEVVVVIVEKLTELGVILDANGITLCTYFPDSKDVLHWIASPDFSHVGKYLLPYFDHVIFKDAWQSKEQGDSYFSKSYSVENKNSFFKHAFEHSDYKNFPEEIKQWIFNNDKHTLSFAWQKNSAILIPSNTGVLPTDAEREILIRFSKVFEQAYIRFMDLQKAEAQAREAQIETALEKVRSRTMAMQHSDELPEAANNLFLQVQSLGIPAWSAGYCIWEDENKKSAWCNMSSEGEIQKGFSLPTIGEGYDFYKPLKKKQDFYVAELGGKALVKHYDFMKKLPIVGEVLEEFSQKGIALPTFQIFHIVFFTHGYLMFITYEAVPNEWDIFKRFGKVFEQTYTRFLDLRKAEAQSDLIKKEKERLEVTLSELKATQSQLIQSEKMASLGELTAGIAHEIQNPLNFVNNFSEVSKELLDEMLEEIENGDMEEVKAIMNDVIQNLEKINHHGKRADGIVKGMLQHSRASGSQKEPTNINALADEYLRLAYHGLRAKDKSFNATLETDFDDTLEKINVIPQDIGRVVLNLLTNAFYVVNEKKQSNQNGFKPTVKLSTKKNGNWVTISVKDNGNGIPQKVLDKIFQPFFTTKPTGQGTGLGLSMSYDIVTKSHGGELKVETEQGKGTEFIIKLPI